MRNVKGIADVAGLAGLEGNVSAHSPSVGIGCGQCDVVVGGQAGCIAQFTATHKGEEGVVLGYSSLYAAVVGVEVCLYECRAFELVAKDEEVKVVGAGSCGSDIGADRHLAVVFAEDGFCIYLYEWWNGGACLDVLEDIVVRTIIRVELLSATVEEAAWSARPSQIGVVRDVHGVGVLVEVI